MKIKRFNCNVPNCKKTFRSEENFMSHLLFHRDQQLAEQQVYSFQCEICSQTFPTKRSVSAHKRFHKSNKEFHLSYELTKIFGHQLSMCLQKDYSQERPVFDQKGLVLPEISCPNIVELPLFETVLKPLEEKSVGN